MRPKKLNLRDFGSFHEAEIDLSPVTLAAVVGENGAGKSTLLTAMSVALFGSAVGPLDGFVRQGAAGFQVRFSFEVGASTYEVVREVGRAQKVALNRVGHSPVCEAKVREVDAAIIDLLGCDFTGFSLAHHLPQGALGAFVAMDPASRKEWLLTNLPMRVWSALEGAAKAEAAKSIAAIRDGEAVIRTIGEQMPDVDWLEEDRTGAAAMLEQRRAGLAITEEDVAKGSAARELRSELTTKEAFAHQNAIRTAADMDDLQERTARTRSELDARPEPVLVNLERIEAEVERTRAALEDTRAKDAAWGAYTTEKGRLTAEAARCDNLREVALKALENLDAQAEPVCPTCGQDVVGEAARRARNVLHAALDSASDASAAAHEAARSLVAPSYVADESVTARITSEAQEAVQRLSDGRILEYEAERRALYAGKLAELGAALGNAVSNAVTASGLWVEAKDALDNAPNDESADALATLPGIRIAITELERKIGNIDGQIDRAAKMLLDRQRAELSLVEERRHADLLALLVKAYGKGGIPARMLEGAVQEIEAFANDFLGRFTDGLSLEITTQRENKGGGVRETLDILVSDSLGTRPVERYSGGERTRVNFALSVGLSRFLSSLGAGHVDSFVVDEPEYLDTAGVAELVRCLHVLAESVPFVVLVSHIEGVADSLPQRIKVRKGASGSSVTVTL